MPMVHVLLAILALLAFLIGTISVQLPQTSRVNWVALGLAFLTLVFLLRP